MELMRSKQREVEEEKELKALEEENNRFEMACDLKKQQEKMAIREIMLEQMELDRMRKKFDRDETRELAQTHFGPQEDRKVAQQLLNRKREMQNHLNEQLLQQIAANHEGKKKHLYMEKMTDAVNMGAIN